jgi:hypothetical protein
MADAMLLVGSTTGGQTFRDCGREMESIVSGHETNPKATF